MLFWAQIHRIDVHKNICLYIKCLESNTFTLIQPFTYALNTRLYIKSVCVLSNSLVFLVCCYFFFSFEFRKLFGILSKLSIQLFDLFRMLVYFCCTFFGWLYHSFGRTWTCGLDDSAAVEPAFSWLTCRRACRHKKKKIFKIKNLKKREK